MPKQFGRFIIAGALNTLVDWGVLNILLAATHAQTLSSYALFKSLSFACAVTASYFLNKHFVFQTRGKSSPRRIALFVGVSCVGWLINAAVATYAAFALPFRLFLIQANAGAILGTAAGLVWNYIGYKKLVFKRGGELI